MESIVIALFVIAGSLMAGDFIDNLEGELKEGDVFCAKASPVEDGAKIEVIECKD